MNLRYTCITYFAKSKTKPQGDANHTLWSRHASVWNFYKVLILNIFGTPWIVTLSLLDECLFIQKYGLSLFLSFLFIFFSSCPLACIFFSHAFWHGYFSFLSFFSIAHTILFGTWKFLRERHMINEWSNYLVDRKSMFLSNSQCKSQ